MMSLVPDKEHDGLVAVWAYFDGEKPTRDNPIGYLPEDAATRYINESAAGAFAEESVFDSGKELFEPYLKIYW